jgi:hypothetical protein
MMRAARVLCLFFTFFLMMIPTTDTSAQDDELSVTLTVRAAFDGSFRDSAWLPIRVRVENNGAALSGQIVVRPETSGAGILGTFSAPITLPEGAQQIIDLAISARGVTRDVRVEVIDVDGQVVTSTTAALRGLNQHDRLYVVVTESAAGAVDLTGVRVGGFSAAQAVWTPSELPTRTALLDAVDVILFDDADTGVLTADQRAALAGWVSGGGHLIVAGGANWQATAAGLGDLLALVPESAQTIDSLRPLGDWLRTPTGTALDVPTTIAVGTLKANARPLVSSPDGMPLLARADYGDGTLDYLAADAIAAPLRRWTRLTEFWFTLMTTTPPALGWSMGITDTEQAIAAAQILPGFDALPDILPLCGFLFGYIALIGPVNYLILSRINRREWAWITIPALIVLFTGLSFVIGTNLRGSDAIVNDLSMVRAWSGTPVARTESVIGLLSPLRTSYTLTLPGGETLRPIPRAVTGGSLFANAASVNTINIAQTDTFAASNFIVDASFIAPFSSAGLIDAPAISGAVTLSYDRSFPGHQQVRGSIRNDSDVTLRDPVILARGATFRLAGALEPGAVLPFDLTLAGESAVSPAFRAPTLFPTITTARGYQVGLSEASVIDILGQDRFVAQYSARAFVDQTPEALDDRRRQFLLSSFIDDGDGATGRGDRIYLVGWSDAPVHTLTLDGANWSAQHATAVIVGLDTSVERAADPVTIAQDRFSWVVTEQTGIAATPSGINFLAGESAAFRFTPLPDAVLARVDELVIRLRDVNIGSRVVPIALWNYRTETWDDHSVIGGDLRVPDPTPYLGTFNAVQIRLAGDSVGGFMRIGEVTVEQTGVF